MIKKVSNFSFLQKSWVATLSIAFLLIPFYFFLYRLHIHRINAFGCFDDCFNYGAGYFLLHGKSLYSQIFFNHQPLMAYFSFLIQKTFHITNMFALLLRHRQVAGVFYYLWGVLLIRRFRWSGVVFVVTYELTKFYLFGGRFLAEAFIVYPLAYMTGVAWLKLQGERLHKIEYLFCGFLTWLVVFSREPYVPAVLFTLALITWKPIDKAKLAGIALFVLLSVVILSLLPFQMYWLNVFTFSVTGVAVSENASTHILGIGALQVFFYPLFIFFQGPWNAMRVILLGFATVFVGSLVVLSLQKSKRLTVHMFLMVILLGLLNLRPVQPGTIFYSAFHMLVWYGSFLLLTTLLLQKLSKKWQRIGYIILGASLLCYMFLAKDIFKSAINPHVEFVTNYGTTYGLGETVRRLSTPRNTFFIDGYDDLILSYIQSQRNSPYQYSWNVYIARGNKNFEGLRRKMFVDSPPDFYYGRTWRSVDSAGRPSPYSNIYTQVAYYGKPSNLFIKTAIYNNITDAQWASVKQFGYEKTVISPLPQTAQ